MSYRITWEERGAYLEYNGAVSAEDVINSNNEFYDHIMSDKSLYQIIDFSNIHKLDADKKTIKYAIAMSCGHSLTTRNLKVACVIRRSEIFLSIAGYVKELIIIHPNWSFRVFEDISSARKWVAKTQ